MSGCLRLLEIFGENDHTRVGPDGLSLPVNFRSPYSVFPKNCPIFSVACDTYGSLSYMYAACGVADEDGRVLFAFVKVLGEEDVGGDLQAGCVGEKTVFMGW